jgi:hypothetical protein
MRNIWDTKRGFMKGLITAPKQLKSAGVKRLMEDALWAQGPSLSPARGVMSFKPTMDLDGQTRPRRDKCKERKTADCP